jgi:catechol 2,3-dioxygenase-like lactoylglutathione lyase family enzyme
MQDAPASIMSHVSIGTNNLAAATAFYDRVLNTLGIERKETIDGFAVAYGRSFPEFWVSRPFDERTANVGNGTHFAFIASSKAQVHAFHDAALAAGGKDDGEPGQRPIYGPQYYGAYVRDPEGHKIEAAFWDEGDQGDEGHEAD